MQQQQRAAWAIALAVVSIVAYGVWHSITRRSVERTVQSFLAAMIAGDRDAFSQHLGGSLLLAYSAKTADEQQESTQPIPGARAEIWKVYLRGSSAKVRVRWQVSGFDVWSSLELAKADAGEWKVTHIGEPKMVPSWDQVLRKLEQKSQGPPVHESLAEELQDREGVEVRPLSADDLDQ